MVHLTGKPSIRRRHAIGVRLCRICPDERKAVRASRAWIIPATFLMETKAHEANIVGSVPQHSEVLVHPTPESRNRLCGGSDDSSGGTSATSPSGRSSNAKKIEAGHNAPAPDSAAPSAHRTARTASQGMHRSPPRTRSRSAARRRDARRPGEGPPVATHIACWDPSPRVVPIAMVGPVDPRKTDFRHIQAAKALLQRQITMPYGLQFRHWNLPGLCQHRRLPTTESAIISVHRTKNLPMRHGRAGQRQGEFTI